MGKPSCWLATLPASAALLKSTRKYYMNEACVHLIKKEVALVGFGVRVWVGGCPLTQRLEKRVHCGRHKEEPLRSWSDHCRQQSSGAQNMWLGKQLEVHKIVTAAAAHGGEVRREGVKAETGGSTSDQDRDSSPHNRPADYIALTLAGVPGHQPHFWGRRAVVFIICRRSAVQLHVDAGPVERLRGRRNGVHHDGCEWCTVGVEAR